jgi:Ca-activated chloride channel family protein
MHLINKMFLSFIFTILMLGPASAHGQPMEEANKTLSPYFFVKSDDPSVNQLPLKSTSADIKVIGVIADIVVTQVYKNEGKKPLEAIYIFPASTRSAVYGMKMTIGKRTIIAKIQERGEARRQYEEAKQQGKSVSLLEQQRPNVFQMNVANILPGDVIQVELKYTELLVPTDGIYEFVYPTVVGPRYSNQPAETAPLSEKWVENPCFHQGESPTYTFEITVDIAAGLPIQNTSCSSHKVNIHYDGPSRASIKLDPSEKNGGNRDFIVKYQLAGGKIQSGILLSEGEKGNFFLVMLQPPKRVNVSQIPPREYIFIVDVSGSMYGFPLEISKKLLKDLIGNLRSTDKFNVLLFSGGSSVMAEQSLSATPENIRQAINLIDRQRGGGGTELLPALKRALSLPRSDGYS